MHRSTIVFGQSRTAVEVMLKYLREWVRNEGLDERTVMAYRGDTYPKNVVS